jgi:hypothetical protein
LSLPLIVLSRDVTKERTVIASTRVEEQRQERRNEPIGGHGDKVGGPNVFEKGNRAVLINGEMSRRIHEQRPYQLVLQGIDTCSFLKLPANPDFLLSVLNRG